MANLLLALAEHAASWRERAPDEALAHHARRALVDWFGCLLADAQHPPATLIAAALADETRGGGGAVCYVTGRRVPLRHAALVNGTASHMVEFDDIYRYAGSGSRCSPRTTISGTRPERSARSARRPRCRCCSARMRSAPRMRSPRRRPWRRGCSRRSAARG
jgi:hypothetical protein